MLSSTVLNNFWEVDYIRTLLPKSKFNLLYRGSRDGFSAQRFHALCDKKGPTITVVRSYNGRVFGGYTDKNWDSSSQTKNSDATFLFSVTHKQKYSPKDEPKAIAMDAECGPMFGSGSPDLYISDNCNAGFTSFSYLNINNNRLIDEGQYHFSLAGELLFRVDDYEVYQVF